MATITLISNKGLFSWWTHPIAIRVGDLLYICTITSDGEWRYFLVDLTNMTITNQVVSTANEPDDHNAPSILVRSGKAVLSFFTRHNVSAHVNKVSASAGTIAFGTNSHITNSVTVTYTQILNKDDVVVMLTRGNLGKWYYNVSTDYGSTWGGYNQLFNDEEDGQTYLTTKESETEPGVYHFTAYGHPNASTWRGMGYGRIDLNTMKVGRTDCGCIGDLTTGVGLPLKKEVLEQIDPVQFSDQRTRLLDVGEKYGQVIVYYAKWSDSYSPRYYQAVRETDGTWTRTYTNISAGVSFYPASTYVGGMAMDNNGANQVYICRSSPGGSMWYLEKYPINSDFTLGTPTLLDSSSSPLVRPYAPFNLDGVLYQKLSSYTDYQNWAGQLYLWKP